MRSSTGSRCACSTASGSACRGGPDSKVGWSEVTQKFRSITRELLSTADQDRVVGLVTELDKCTSPAAIGELCRIAARPQSRPT